jgi:hypothetical protein
MSREMTSRAGVMVAAWSTRESQQAFEPWACANCPSGKMVWFACDLRPGQIVIEHKFACDSCGGAEHVIVPLNFCRLSLSPGRQTLSNPHRRAVKRLNQCVTPIVSSFRQSKPSSVRARTSTAEETAAAGLGHYLRRARENRTHPTAAESDRQGPATLQGHALSLSGEIGTCARRIGFSSREFEGRRISAQNRRGRPQRGRGARPGSAPNLAPSRRAVASAG